MTDLVPQREKMDCGICVFAMATGRDYEDVKAALGDAWSAENGLRRLHDCIERLGLGRWREIEPGKPGRIFDSPDVQVRYRGYEVAPKFFRDFAWGRRAIMCVPSLNLPSGLHMVWVEHEQVFDPSRGKTYDWDALAPEEIILFRERAP